MNVVLGCEYPGECFSRPPGRGCPRSTTGASARAVPVAFYFIGSQARLALPPHPQKVSVLRPGHRTPREKPCGCQHTGQSLAYFRRRMPGSGRHCRTRLCGGSRRRLFSDQKCPALPQKLRRRYDRPSQAVSLNDNSSRLSHPRCPVLGARTIKFRIYSLSQIFYCGGNFPLLSSLEIL